MSNRCLHKGTIENSESMFPKRKGKKSIRWQKNVIVYHYNTSLTLPLKTSRNILFLYKLLQFDKNNKCFGGCGLTVSEDLEPMLSITQKTWKPEFAFFFFAHVNAVCLNLWVHVQHHVEHFVVMFVYYSWNSIHLPLKSTSETWFSVSHCFLLENNCHLC